MSIKKNIEKYISKWNKKGYLINIPDEIPNRIHQLNLAPSYKSIAIAILNNDHSLQSLGQSPAKSFIYSELKKIELISKNKIKKSKQIKLKL